MCVSFSGSRSIYSFISFCFVLFLCAKALYYSQRRSTFVFTCSLWLLPELARTFLYGNGWIVLFWPVLNFFSICNKAINWMWLHTWAAKRTIKMKLKWIHKRLSIQYMGNEKRQNWTTALTRLFGNSNGNTQNGKWEKCQLHRQHLPAPHHWA